MKNLAILYYSCFFKFRTQLYTTYFSRFKHGFAEWMIGLQYNNLACSFQRQSRCYFIFFLIYIIPRAACLPREEIQWTVAFHSFTFGGLGQSQRILFLWITSSNGSDKEFILCRACDKWVMRELSGPEVHESSPYEREIRSKLI